MRFSNELISQHYDVTRIDSFLYDGWVVKILVISRYEQALVEHGNCLIGLTLAIQNIIAKFGIMWDPKQLY